jgi:hypothetical protein
VALEREAELPFGTDNCNPQATSADKRVVNRVWSLDIGHWSLVIDHWSKPKLQRGNLLKQN